jgi:DNA-binding GntR family transcriptional regulator
VKSNPELTAFNMAMDRILKADPKAVKAAMEAEKAANAEKRKAKTIAEDFVKELARAVR